MRLPFWIWPFSWGLKGKAREIARAEYELSGAARDLKVHELRKDEFTPRLYKERELELKHKHGMYSDEEYQRALAQLIESEPARTIALLGVDKAFGKITDVQYQKAVATAQDEPWVTVVHMDFDHKNTLEGSFELDWNEQFVESLQLQGYTGPTPDHIVNTWFMEVCKNIATEEFDGTGDFQSDAEHNLNTMKRWHSSQVDNARSSYR